jgi:hypothetical protein
MRLSIIYDDLQAGIAASVDPNDADKPLRGGHSDGDVDISREKADRGPTESAKRSRGKVQPQKQQHPTN